LRNIIAPYIGILAKNETICPRGETTLAHPVTRIRTGHEPVVRDAS